MACASEKREDPSSHKEAVEAMNRYGIKEPVNALPNRNVKLNKRKNHNILESVSEAIKFMTRQGISLRGDSHPGSSPTEPSSNTH